MLISLRNLRFVRLAEGEITLPSGCNIIKFNWSSEPGVREMTIRDDTRPVKVIVSFRRLQTSPHQFLTSTLLFSPSSPCLLSQQFLLLLNFNSVIYIDLRSLLCPLISLRLTMVGDPFCRSLSSCFIFRSESVCDSPICSLN